MNHRVSILLVSLLLVGGLVGLSNTVAAQDGSETDGNLTAIDANHPLDSESAFERWDDDGYASGEVPELDMRLSVAEKRSDLDRSETLLEHRGSDYLRIEYREDIERDLRILIPKEYATPYTREGVESINGRHTADFSPARDGEYMEVVVHVDGPQDIVLPLDRKAQLSYRIVGSVSERIDAVTGYSPLGSEGWTYVERGDLSSEGSVAVMKAPEDPLVQYDATPEKASERWINAPRGDSDAGGINWYIRENDEGEEMLYVVSTTDDPPAVRVKDEATMVDRVMGWINGALDIPSNLPDVPSPFAFVGSVAMLGGVIRNAS